MLAQARLPSSAMQIRQAARPAAKRGHAHAAERREALNEYGKFSRQMTVWSGPTCAAPPTDVTRSRSVAIHGVIRTMLDTDLRPPKIRLCRVALHGEALLAAQDRSM